MGGSDDSSNLVELTIEEHAEAHKVLYEQYGNWKDFIAYSGLLKLMTTDECYKIAIREGAKKGARASNLKRWGIGSYADLGMEVIPHWKLPKNSKYPVNVDGRKVRSKRYWFNDGNIEGQYSLTDYPQSWTRGRLRSVMNKVNKNVIL